MATLALAVAGPAFADEPAPAAAAPVPVSPPPPLILAISVDQFSADLFAQYREHFSGGLARLLTGAVFPSGFQSHAATETCPGHSTILTGTRPARSGIVANWWFDPKLTRADKRVYCSEDESDPASTSEKPVVSARHLKVPTLGDRLKALDPKSRNVAVSAKDRGAVMMGGHAIDAAYWWNGAAFETFKGRKASLAAQTQNARIAALTAKGDGDLPVPAWCAVHDRAIPVGARTVGTYRFAVPAGQATAWGRTPRMDAATADLAIALADELKLGRDASPDVLSVSLSVTDFVGHAYGTEGVEMCIQLAQLDQTLGRLFAALDERGIDYAAALTADHGGIDAPERLNEQGYPAAERISEELDVDAVGEAVSRYTGIKAASGPLLFGGGGSGDIYVSDKLGLADRARVIEGAVAHLGRRAQVADVMTAEEVAALPMPTGSPQDWTIRQRVRASFLKGVSGDVIVMLKRGVVAANTKGGSITTHGSPWDYDRRVPILFWRKGMTGLEQPAPVETVDIAPTLAALLRLTIAPGEFDGRCLDIDGGEGSTCPTAR
ncbi:MAG TPA: alkaline phosphatase family protein [Sphingomicrobium sp.]|nr:alkaline phosphatase family protein [Sphingomicrobium sp.]